MAILYTASRHDCEVGDTNVVLSVLNNITETSKYSRYYMYTLMKDLTNLQCACAEGLWYLSCVSVTVLVLCVCVSVCLSVNKLSCIIHSYAQSRYADFQKKKS